MSNFSSNTRMQKPWSDLPGELVGQILRRLNFIDVARARSVCSHWSSVSPDNQTPWLLIPPKPDPNCGIGKGVSQLYNPADGRLHRTKTLPDELETSFLIGSSHGCLIGLPWDNYEGLVPFVLNPLTGTRISLPCIDNLIDDSSFPRQGKVQDCVKKAVLTTELSQAGCVAVFLYGTQRQRPWDQLTACSISDSWWTKLDTGDYKRYIDVCSAHGKMFLLGSSFSVEIWDSSKPPFRKLSTLRAQRPEFAYTPWNTWLRYYIAMPLLVVKKWAYLSPGAYDRYRTVGFEVYKMDDMMEEWVEAESLGENKALFLGASHSVFVPATGGIVADCIYYSSEDLSYQKGRDEQVAGVFNLRDGEMMTDLDDWWGEDSGRWIVPTL